MTKIIKFAPRHEAMPIIEEFAPQPATNFIPEWFKDVPHFYNSPDKTILDNKLTSGTVRKCPSFAELFKYGYCLVAPTDIYIKIIKVGGELSWTWKTPNNLVNLDHHPDEQMKDYFPDKDLVTIMKINYPYIAITPKGYSCLQIPMMYHPNKDWYVPFGIIDTDMYHELNPQLMITTTEDEFVIKAGTPLSYLFPYKREKFTHTFLNYEDAKETIKKMAFVATSRFTGAFYKNIKSKN